MKIKEILGKNEQELKKELENLSVKLSKLRFDIVTKQGKNVAEVKKIKKDIARIKTILKEKEIVKEEQNEKKS